MTVAEISGSLKELKVMELSELVKALRGKNLVWPAR